MRKCLIIGGGLAGLSTAVHLAKNNHRVELIEASPKLGGRAYSYFDRSLGLVVDNGQHLIMGCYHSTIEYLNIIGASSLLEYPPTLTALFNDGYNNYNLKVPSALPFPINLLTSVLLFKYLSISEKNRLVIFFIRLKTGLNNSEGGNAEDWLVSEGQSTPRLLEFWRLIGVSALNSEISSVSAIMFRKVLLEMFMKGTFESTLLVPKRGLTEVFINKAIEYLDERKGIISTGEKAVNCEFRNGKIENVLTSQRKIDDFDDVVLALPTYSPFLSQIIPPGSLDKYQYSTIISVHINIKYTPKGHKFVGFFNSPIHWVFFHRDHISLVISAAGKLLELNSAELLSIVRDELKMRLDISGIKSEDIRIIREKRATYISSPELDVNRISQKTNYSNFFLAGDYTDTGLPSTIEGAILSGKNAAGMVLNQSYQ